MTSPRRTASNPDPTPSTADPTPTGPAPGLAGGLLFQRGSGSGSPGPESQPPTPDPTTDPIGSPFASTPGPGDPDGADGRGPGSGSGPRSTRGGQRRRQLGKRELRDAAQAMVTTAGGIAHSLLTRAGSTERDAGLWIPDGEDVDTIADPLAGLASRRTPEGVDNPDATDLVRLLVGVAGYVVKQLRRRAELRNGPDVVDYLAGGVDYDPDTDGRDPGRDPGRSGSEPGRADRPAAGPVAWLRNRHEGGETRTDPQPDLDLSTPNERDTAP